MQEESACNLGPVFSSQNMDVNSAKNRGLLQATSNNADIKNVRESTKPKGNSRRRDNPRGGYDVNWLASSGGYGGRGGGRRQRDHQRQRGQNSSASSQSLSSGYGTNPYAGGAGKPSVMLEDEFEVGSVFNAGSKKQNINHLLNFQFEPRGSQANKKSANNTKQKFFSKSSGPKYNKEQYLQANCQFVVKSSGDYSVHLADPDTLVNWDLVEQVVLKTTASVPSCPICLYPPKAAKVTRCGHVFCWPCILHYLALSDHAWRKCPICYEAIHKPDLKSVVSVPWKEFQINDEIELCLMRRERNSLFALPVDHYFAGVNDKHPSVNNKLTSYSNLVLATPGQVVNGIIAKERYELEQQYRDEKDEPEACFIEEALQYLSQRESGIDITADQHSTITEEVVSEESSNSDDTSDLIEGILAFPLDLKEDCEDECSGGRPRHASSSSDGTIESLDDNIIDEVTAEDLDIEKKSSKTVAKETFYFYQSSDGQPIFLHALNVQMLVHEYGSLENCPTKITGKIIEKDNTSMNESLRNRLRYLRHLPLTSIFEVCEIQLKSPFVNKETLTEFSTQLEKRRRRRNKADREEKRREKWIEVEENKKMGKYPDMRCRIESAFHFPNAGPGLDIQQTRATVSMASSIDSTLSISPNGAAYGASQEMVSNDGSFSFAKMLKKGAAKPSTYAPEALKSSAMFNVAPKPSKNDDSEPEPEDYIPPPPKASLGDALAQALENAKSSGNGNSVAAPASTSGGGGKKSNKKGKKMKGQKISLTGSGPHYGLN